MPLTDSKGQGIPYPVLTDVPNAETFGRNLVEAVAGKLVMVYPSASVRGATITSPTSGMVSYLADVKRLEIYDGNSWQHISHNPRVGIPFTPQISGDLFLGNGLTFANYTLDGAWVQYTAMILFGTTTAITGNQNAYIELPVAVAKDTEGNRMNFAGSSVVNPQGGIFRMGGVWCYSTSPDPSNPFANLRATLNVLHNNEFRSYGAAGLTFSSGGWISVNLRYRAA